jgi:hypothetical protein
VPVSFEADDLFRLQVFSRLTVFTLSYTAVWSRDPHPSPQLRGKLGTLSANFEISNLFCRLRTAEAALRLRGLPRFRTLPRDRGSGLCTGCVRAIRDDLLISPVRLRRAIS